MAVFVPPPETPQVALYNAPDYDIGLTAESHFLFNGGKVSLPRSRTLKVVEYNPPDYGAVPIAVQSHAYHYIVTGNTLIPPLEITRALVAATTPKSAIAALMNEYKHRDYPLAGITGDVDVDGKTVRIFVFEGMITEVKAPKGMGWFFHGLSWRKDLHSREITRKQLLANAAAARAGKTLEVNISPSTNPGGSTLSVRTSPVADYSPLTASLSFGNYGSRYASGYIAGADAALNLAHGVQVTADYMKGLSGLTEISRGSRYSQAGFGASVVTPYGIYGITASFISFRLGDATFPLNPSGNVDTFQLSGTQLVYADDATRVWLSEAISDVNYKENVFDGAFTLIDQPYDYLSLRSSVEHSLTVDGLAAKVSGAVAVNLGISGTEGTLASDQPGLPTPQFRYADFTLGYHQDLPLGLDMDLTSAVRWTEDTLPVQQQWVLGGMGNLTAWEPGVVAADRGYNGRVQINAPAIKQFDSSAQFGVFLETGGASFAARAPGTPSWQALSDAGLSLKLELPYKLSATALAAWPIEQSGFNAIGRSNLDLNRIDAFFLVRKGF
ncbi:MAG: ShlB/FhaC/HecB family hemolysin secretion/activation protein [Alphaproteobacteria bacterium]